MAGSSLVSTLILLVAIVYPFISLVREVPISPSFNNMDTTSMEYNIKDIKAPKVAGPLIHALSYLVAKSPLSPFILRKLLDDNDIHLIRELATSQKCKSLAPTYFPAHKANVTDELKAKAKEHRQFLKTGIDLQTPTNSKGKYHSIMDYHRLYKANKAIPSQVMEELIVGAKKLEHLKMFSSFLPDDIRKQAKGSDERWKNGNVISVFDGVPVAIKDQIPVKGHRFCRGSMIEKCVHADEDDMLVKKLRDAGAIIVGVTVMTEGGVTPLGYNVHFDGPFNPYDTDYYSGGSSSGSAVAVSSGLVPIAIGFDGGGSVRVPAAMSGTMGLAVTNGRFAFDSTSTVTKAGPLATTLEDVALTHLLLGENIPNSVYGKLIGEDNFPPPHLGNLVDSTGDVIEKSDLPLSGIRLGVQWDHFKHTDEEVYEACLKSVKYLESLGAEIVDINIANLKEIHLSHAMTILSEFGVIWEKEFNDPSHVLEPNTEITLALGRALRASETLSAAKVRSYGIQQLRTKIFEGLKIDAIVSPALGSKVPKPPSNYRGHGESDNAKVYKIMRFVPMANFLGLPGLVVPVNYEKDSGMPISFQLMGDAWSEHKLVEIGVHLENRLERKLPQIHHEILHNFA